MVDLKCEKTNCIHNKNCNCSAKLISVDKQTYCNSYREAHNKNTSEMANEIAQPLVRNNTDVNCDAKCVFNDSGICKANGISVTTTNFDPECSTFLPR